MGGPLPFRTMLEAGVLSKPAVRSVSRFRRITLVTALNASDSVDYDKRTNAAAMLQSTDCGAEAGQDSPWPARVGRRRLSLAGSP